MTDCVGLHASDKLTQSCVVDGEGVARRWRATRRSWAIDRRGIVLIWRGFR